MKLTIFLAVTLATVVSLCTASPTVLTRAMELVHQHMNPPETETVVVYTPVQQVVPVQEAAHHSHHPHHNLLRSFAHGRVLPELGALLKHPVLQKLPLLNLLPWRTPGGVEEVEVHQEAATATGAPYPPPPGVHELPQEPEPAVPVPDGDVTPAPVAPVVPEYVAPPPVYGVPAPVYGVPAPTGSEFSSASSGSGSGSTASGNGNAGAASDAQYVAVNPGARHEAPLPGHSESVLFENLQPAPGTDGQEQQVVQSDMRNVFNPAAVLDATSNEQLPADYLRSAATPDVWTEAEPRYIAINGDLRHEAPLPGYDRSIVIENTDKL